MKLKKQFLSIALSMTMAAVCMPAVFAAETAFTDVDEQSYYSEAVNYMTENNLMVVNANH